MNESESAGTKYASKHHVAEAAKIKEERKDPLHFPSYGSEFNGPLRFNWLVGGHILPLYILTLALGSFKLTSQKGNRIFFQLIIGYMHSCLHLQSSMH